MTVFVELHDLTGNPFCVNADAVDAVSTLRSDSRNVDRTLIRLRNGDQLYAQETYDEVHAQLYGSIRDADRQFNEAPKLMPPGDDPRAGDLLQDGPT